MSLLVVMCTFPDLTSARSVVSALVDARLAACATLSTSVESIYRWEGRIENSQEVLAMIKTTRETYPALERKLKQLHPYQVPEILALASEAVSSEYAKWVHDSVEPEVPESGDAGAERG